MKTVPLASAATPLAPKFTAVVAVFSAAVLLSACAGLKTTAPEVNPTDMPKGPGLLSGESGNLLDAFRSSGATDQSGGKIGVSVYLWRAALESVSFMPLASADSQGGVILTDWYAAPENPTERAKLNIMIVGTSIQANAVQVKLFKQKLIASSWKDIPVNPATEDALEEAILTKARALRVQAEASGVK